MATEKQAEANRQNVRRSSARRQRPKDNHAAVAPRGPGQPTKFTPTITHKILEHVALGSPMEIACLAAGVTARCVIGWRHAMEALSDPSRSPYYQFFQALQKAHADAVAVWLTTLDQACAKGQWQAAAWKLERRWPQFFALKRDTTPPIVLIQQIVDKIVQLVPDSAQQLRIAEVLESSVDESR